MAPTSESSRPLTISAFIRRGIIQSLGSKPLSTITKLDTYDCPELREHLLSNRLCSSHAECDEAFLEFKKYVGLVAIYNRRLTLADERALIAWREFVLFGQDYEEFCRQMLGGTLYFDQRRCRDEYIADYQNCYNTVFECQ